MARTWRFRISDGHEECICGKTETALKNVGRNVWPEINDPLVDLHRSRRINTRDEKWLFSQGKRHQGQHEARISFTLSWGKADDRKKKRRHQVMKSYFLLRKYPV